MEPLALGLILLGLAIPLYIAAARQRALLRGVRATEVSAIDHLRLLHRRVAAEVGHGLFRQRVAVNGMVHCDLPLTSELGSIPCVAFRYTVERRWEEPYQERDGKGVTRTGTRTGRDRVAGNDRRTPFWVADASDKLLVHPEGARIDGEVSVDRFEPGTGGSVLRVGGISVDLGPWLAERGRRRTVGYHFHEEVLPIGRPIYVLGTASDADGELALRASPDEERFLISLKTREQVVAATDQRALYLRLGSTASAVLGLAMIIAWMLTHR